MVNKVRVYGKAQNRTALGIVHAYMIMYPHATLTDLRKAFPNKLAAMGANFSEIFVCVDDKSISKEDYDTWYFNKQDELLTMGDGKRVAMRTMWTKDSFENIVDHAKQYCIEVAKFQAADKGGKKGGFRLEYLNGYIPPKSKKKKSLLWLWILLIVLVIGGIVAYFVFNQSK